MYVVDLKDRESLFLSEISYWKEYKALLEDSTLDALVFVYEFQYLHTVLMVEKMILKQMRLSVASLFLMLKMSI